MFKMAKAGNSKGVFYAKFTPGAIVSEVRGKIAATVFSRNKGGAVIRNRIKPINRRSVLQSTRRQVLGNLASSWRGLSESERASWNSAAPNFPVQDTLGQTIYLSGEQMYVRFNANLVLMGEAEIQTAPTSFAFSIFTITLTAAAGAGTVSLAFTPSPMPAGNALAVYATEPLSPGISSPNASKFRYLQTIEPTDTTPVDIATAYVALFGAITTKAGEKIFVEVRPIAFASGQPGAPLRAFDVVAA